MTPSACRIGRRAASSKQRRRACLFGEGATESATKDCCQTHQSILQPSAHGSPRDGACVRGQYGVRSRRTRPGARANQGSCLSVGGSRGERAGVVCGCRLGLSRHQYSPLNQLPQLATNDELWRPDRGGAR